MLEYLDDNAAWDMDQAVDMFDAQGNMLMVTELFQPPRFDVSMMRALVKIAPLAYHEKTRKLYTVQEASTTVHRSPP
jgi:hypothetical protein